MNNGFTVTFRLRTKFHCCHFVFKFIICYCFPDVKSHASFSTVSMCATKKVHVLHVYKHSGGGGGRGQLETHYHIHTQDSRLCDIMM